MEKEFDEKFPGDVVTMEEDGTHARITSSLYNRDSIKDFINKSIRTLLESFGEEVIGEDETEVNQIARDEKLGVQTYYVITANMKRRNQLRAEQRLKMKEIISSIGK